MKGKTILSDQRASAQTLPASTRAKSDALTADGRKIVSMWDMLVWAYKVECVSAAIASINAGTVAGYSMSPSWNWDQLREMPELRRAQCELKAHDDAMTLAFRVGQLPRETAVMVARCAGAGALPVWDVVFGPDDELRCLPRDDFTSTPPKPMVVMHPRRRDADGCRVEFYCPVDYEGIGPNQRAARVMRARSDYRTCFAAVETLEGWVRRDLLRFSAHFVDGVGLIRAPWETAAEGVP